MRYLLCIKTKPQNEHQGTMPQKKKQIVSLSKSFQELEAINTWFQGDEFDLEEALKKYTRGMELVKACEEQLKEVENKILEIKKRSE